jgi:hypothetical protein
MDSGRDCENTPDREMGVAAGVVLTDRIAAVEEESAGALLTACIIPLAQCAPDRHEFQYKVYEYPPAHQRQTYLAPCGNMIECVRRSRSAPWPVVDQQNKFQRASKELSWISVD